MKIRVRQITTENYGIIEIDDKALEGRDLGDYLDDNLDDILWQRDADKDIETVVEKEVDGEFVDFCSFG